MHTIELLAYQANERIEGWLEAYDKRFKAKQKYVRPTHLLMCECRKCVVSVDKFWRRMES